MMKGLFLSALACAVAVSAVDPPPLTGEVQVLKMGVMKAGSTKQIASFSKVCPDDEIDAVIDYSTSDNAQASGLSFKVQFETKFLEVIGKPTSSMPMEDCPITFVSDAIKLDDHFSYVTMVCADMGNKKVVADKAPGVLTIKFKVKKGTGGGTANIVMMSNPKLAGTGYVYKEVRPKKTLKVQASCDRDEL